MGKKKAAAKAKKAKSVLESSGLLAPVDVGAVPSTTFDAATAHGHAHAHSHSHSHSHENVHSHGHVLADAHMHTHGDPATPEVPLELTHEHAPSDPPLERGAGVGKILFFDAFSGLAGDMTIAALLDLGAPLAVVEDAVATLGLSGFHLHVGHRHRSAIVATHFDVRVADGQPRRDYREIDALLANSKLDPSVRDLSRRIFRRLGEAEARVHRMPLESVHFHEVGAVDALVDIVGAAALLTYVGARVVSTPLPMGRGFVRSEHGKMPNPPPAVVECLRGIPTYSVDIDFELVTPTGAAILATVAKRFMRWPTLTPTRVGYGAGTKELSERPNLLRVVLGEENAREEASSDAAPTHVVLEANIDDMTGEQAAYAIATLLEAGALDAWAVPVTMKKGRPGLVMSALAPRELSDRIAEAMLRETTSLGVRRTPVSRLERPRRMTTVTTRFGEVRCKVSEGPYGPPIVKPEHDDCARLAGEHGVALREVVAAALATAGCDSLTR